MAQTVSGLAELPLLSTSRKGRAVEAQRRESRWKR